MSTFLYDKIIYTPTKTNVRYTPTTTEYTSSSIPARTVPKATRSNALPELAMARELESRVRTLNSALNKQLSLMAR